ncbi:YciI family protein [Methylobacterium sp. J-088]|uniref:YciI family protein n=1 Tax=unclassified Methylobacterium TaxID=2615210 RepID=UPI001FB8757B|nr:MULTISPECIES: YciI family protein [unclassified Methylobacterium]MCJ2061586.1 YciI family protein [Methylobacterium sp. J-088]
MPFIIETFDKPGSLEIRRAHRAEHLAYLDRIKKSLLACGAKLNDDGSDAGGGLYVVDVETRAEAEALIQADPFHTAGLFDRVAIKRWRKAYLDGRSYL